MGKTFKDDKWNKSKNLCAKCKRKPGHIQVKNGLWCSDCYNEILSKIVEQQQPEKFRD